MARYKNEDNILMMFNRFYHMCKTREQRTLVLDMKQAFLEIPIADVVPKSEVEKLQAELDSKQFRCDSCDRIMLTGAEHRACVKQAKAEVAKEIFEEIDGITELFAKGLIEELEMYDKLAELKKKYSEDKNENT